MPRRYPLVCVGFYFLIARLPTNVDARTKSKHVFYLLLAFRFCARADAKLIKMELNSELDRLQKYARIDAELNKAKAKHPAWPPNMFEQGAIMNEEAGEVTKAVLHYKREGGSLQDVKDELIQTAAMCMRMLEALANES